MVVWSLRLSRKGKWLLEMHGSRLASIGARIQGMLRVPGAVFWLLVLEPLVVCHTLALGCWLRRHGGAVVGVVWDGKVWLRSFAVQLCCGTGVGCFL